jgi:ElaB/YqjD/DUF883 family membrane-anchored ribosome-binding protein
VAWRFHPPIYLEQGMDNSTFSHSSGDAARVSSPTHASGGLAGDQANATAHWAAVDTARDTLSRARNVAHDAVDRLASGASRLVDRLDGQGHKLTDLPQRAWSASRSVVQEHPVQTVLVSLLAGYALARLLGMRGWRQ